MIEVSGVSIRYRNSITALRDVSLTVNPGEFVFVVGPTGAGKSTLLKLLYGEERATEGRVTIAGQELSTIRQRDIPHFRRRLGIVFQDFGLLPDKTAFENVAFALRVTGAGRREICERVPIVMEQVGLSGRAHSFPHQLSGGEQQRAAIARALINDPPLLLADEPTGNLDPDTSSDIMQLFQTISGRGVTVVVATHAARIVDAMQMRVLAFADGRLVRDEAHGNYRETVPTAEESAP